MERSVPPSPLPSPPPGGRGGHLGGGLLVGGGEGLAPLESQSLHDASYRPLLERLVRGVGKPHQRRRIRDLARALGVSATPVREAVFQLVRDGALELKPRHYLRVRRLSLAQYMELREIRLRLEPLAAERALPAIDRPAIAQL